MESEVIPGRVIALVAFTIGCGDSPREGITPPPKLSQLERTISEQLSVKLGRSATVACSGSSCLADVGDAMIPIVTTNGPDGTTWRVRGLLVRSAPIERYLQGALDDLGANQRVTCGPPLRSVEPGARIECALSGGGKAFATIAANGSFTTEIVLDPASAAARSKDLPESALRDRGSASPGDLDDDDN